MKKKASVLVFYVKLLPNVENKWKVKSDQKKLNESNALILKSLMEIRQSYAVPPECNYALPPGHNYALPPAQNYAIPAAPLAEREPQKNTRKTTKKLI